ncbi:AraC family transcriptional regulator [Methylomonas defluvii]|uniref:AraC family transcriptional regulator n=1 Tax=Methylomonas defluvii TaxID=3045149 RepID=A0ABU4UBD6_9GAMM|nr:AraC family transcriptional regulator [Methylomonas sp. OY6]MDX8126675.1 AraC family transcriptional regulator [Methylomonas sp. OY6]
MDDKTASAAYAMRFDRIFDYIDKHLFEPVSVNELSKQANFSRFHFQRQFSAYTGLSTTRYIQLLRLRKASYQLVFQEQRSITDISLDAGFLNAESFSRAFKKCFGQTPTQFRKHPAWQPWNERMLLPKRIRSPQMNVNIVEFSETTIAVLEHRGPPSLIMESVRGFIDWRKQSGLSPIASSRTFGIAYDDPAVTPAESFRFDVCGEVKQPVPENSQGVINKLIPGGRCAVVRHIGSTDRISDSVYYLYREWLPDSGEELREFPLFFHYIKRVPETPEHEQITDVYLPLV